MKMLRKVNKMKSNAKSKIIILIALGIIFALSPIITVNLGFVTGSSIKSLEYSDDINFDNKNPKISAVSGKIHIDNNWTVAKSAGICTGDGTYSDPYVIEDLVIDTNNTGSCILIENSTAYFRIENCTVFNSEGAYNAGILLNNTDNGFLIDNNCSSNSSGMGLFYSDNNTISGNDVNNNFRGIYLDRSDYNTISGNHVNYNYHGILLHVSVFNAISGNIANNNENGIIIASGDRNTVLGNIANNNEYGMYLTFSNYNTVSGNTAYNNDNSGISLLWSDFNTISGNTANNNEYGIFLWYSDYNTVIGNTFLGNNECIEEVECNENIFENNDCGIIFLILIISGVAILGIVTILLIKHVRKRKQ